MIITPPILKLAQTFPQVQDLLDAYQETKQVLAEVNEWIENWETEFTHDHDWPLVKKKIDEVLNERTN